MTATPASYVGCGDHQGLRMPRIASAIGERDLAKAMQKLEKPRLIRTRGRCHTQQRSPCDNHGPRLASQLKSYATAFFRVVEPRRDDRVLHFVPLWTFTRGLRIDPDQDRSASAPSLFVSPVASPSIPFLKARIPYATSPINSGILPRPNRMRTIVSTISQWQALKLPIPITP